MKEEKVMVIPTQMYQMQPDLELCIERYSEFKTRGSDDGKHKGVETDPRFKQIIPYLIYVRDGKILTYLKTKQSSESRLHGKWSIGIGGHINPADGKGIRAVFTAAKRESKEEIGLTPFFDDKKFVEIHTGKGVSDYHIGIGKVVTDWAGVFRESEEISQHQWLTLEELQLKRPLESWTAYLLTDFELRWGEKLHGSTVY